MRILDGGVRELSSDKYQNLSKFEIAEDDDMSKRIKNASYIIERYPIKIARYSMLSHQKENEDPKR